MFDKENRYITRGINKKIDLQLQILLWNLVEDLQREKDYLQVLS